MYRKRKLWGFCGNELCNKLEIMETCGKYKKGSEGKNNKKHMLVTLWESTLLVSWELRIEFDYLKCQASNFLFHFFVDAVKFSIETSIWQLLTQFYGYWLKLTIRQENYPVIKCGSIFFCTRRVNSKSVNVKNRIEVSSKLFAPHKTR